MCFNKRNKTKNETDTAHELIAIRNDAFCSYTLDRARRRLKRIKKHITSEQYTKIWACIQNLDINNPDTYVPEWARQNHDYKRHMLYLRTELADYIDAVIKSKKVGDK